MNTHVEIWSDVMCPFCYIGKRRFEQALDLFPGKDAVTVEWKSFQLDPEAKTLPGKSVNEYLSERKGWTMEYTKRAQSRVIEMAKEVGLEFDFDKAVAANSFDAHRLSHFAKSHGKQDAVEEGLFKAYFAEGRNTADHGTLVQIAEAAGLDSSAARTMLTGNDFADAVENDIYEGRQVGVSGVPFFVFNNTYAVSGAQPSQLFLQLLNKISS